MSSLIKSIKSITYRASIGFAHSRQLPCDNVMTSADRCSIVIADGCLADLEVLLGQLAPGIDCVRVNSEEDASKIVRLALYVGYGHLHFLGHGRPGGIRLGGKFFGVNEFAEFALKQEGARPESIHFWSCRTGEGDDGRIFVDAVSRAFGSPVTAFSGLCGSKSLGGSWIPDVVSGLVSVETPFVDTMGYMHTLTLGTFSTMDSTTGDALISTFSISGTQTGKLYNYDSSDSKVDVLELTAIIPNANPEVQKYKLAWATDNSSFTARMFMTMTFGTESYSQGKPKTLNVDGQAVSINYYASRDASTGAVADVTYNRSTVPVTIKLIVSDANAGASAMPDRFTYTYGSGQSAYVAQGTLEGWIYNSAKTLPTSVDSVIQSSVNSQAVFPDVLTGSIIGSGDNPSMIALVSANTAYTLIADTTSGDNIASTFAITGTNITGRLIDSSSSNKNAPDGTIDHLNLITPFTDQSGKLSSIVQNYKLTLGTPSNGVTGFTANFQITLSFDTSKGYDSSGRPQNILWGSVTSVIKWNDSIGSDHVAGSASIENGSATLELLQSNTSSTGPDQLRYTKGTTVQLFNLEQWTWSDTASNTKPISARAIVSQSTKTTDTISGSYAGSYTGDATSQTNNLTLITLPDLLDITAPIFSGGVVNGSTLTLQYFEPLDAANKPMESSFTVNAGGAAVTVDSVSVSGNKVVITLHTSVKSGDKVTVSYKDPSTFNDAKAIQDGPGNDAADLSAFEVTNNTSSSGSGLTSYSLASDKTFSIGQNTTGKLSDSDGNGTIDSLQLTQSGDDTQNYKLTWIDETHFTANGYQHLTFGSVYDTQGRPSTFGENGYTYQIIWQSRGDYNGTSNVVGYSTYEGKNAGETVVIKFIDANGDGSFDELLYVKSTASAVLETTRGSAVDWAYDASNRPTSVNMVVLTSSQSGAVFSGSVAGSSTAPTAILLPSFSSSNGGNASGGNSSDSTPPGLSSAVVNGSILTLTYNEAIKSSSLPGASSFSVNIASSAGGSGTTQVAVSSVELLNTTDVVLHLASSIPSGASVTVSLSGSTVQDLAGNSASQLSSWTVTNNSANSLPVWSNSPAPVISGGRFPAGKTTDLIVSNVNVSDQEGDSITYSGVIGTKSGSTFTQVAEVASLTFSSASKQLIGKVSMPSTASSVSNYVLRLYAKDSAHELSALTPVEIGVGVPGVYFADMNSATNMPQSFMLRVNDPGKSDVVSTLGVSGKITLSLDGRFTTTVDVSKLKMEGSYLKVPIDLSILPSNYEPSYLEAKIDSGLLVNSSTGAAMAARSLTWSMVITGDGNVMLYSVTVEQGTSGDDTKVYSDTASHWYNGLEGNDSITGGGGKNILSGGAGNDTLVGGSSEDKLSGDQGNDSLDGGAGTDTAIYSGYTSKEFLITADKETNGLFTVKNLTTGEVDTLRNIETISFDDGSKQLATTFSSYGGSMNTIIGSDYADTIDADALRPTGNSITSDWISAGAGNDSINAGAGGDQITGGAGDDTINGGNSTIADRFSGTSTSGSSTGSGTAYGSTTAGYSGLVENRAMYSGPSSKYTVKSYLDDDGSITGTKGLTYYTVKDNRTGSPDGTDTLFNIDALQFTDKEVRLTPNIWVNQQNISGKTTVLGISINGTDFDESLGAVNSGLADTFKGSDRLVGGAGNDTLYGGAGADTLRGDTGNDRLDGGTNKASSTVGSMEMNGLNGYDVAEYSGAASRYTISLRTDDNAGSVTGNAGGTYYTVADSKTSGGDGTDILTNIQVLRFADGEKKLQVVSSPMLTWMWNSQTGTNVSSVVGVNWTGTDWAEKIDAATAENGTAVKDTINGGAGDDTIISGGQGDWIDGGAGNDSIDGGANGTGSNSWDNYDKVHYDASIKRFTIAMSETGGVRTFTVTDKLPAAFGGYGTDTIKNVEILQFSDTQQNLLVQFNANGSNNNIQGTDFGDVIDAKSLADAQAAGGVVPITVGEPAELRISSLPSLADGKYVALLGQAWSSFQPIQYYDNSGSHSATISLTASGGELSGSYNFANIYGQNLQLQIYAADAQGSPTGSVVGSISATFASSRDFITPGSGDDVVYAGAGGDTIIDGTGNDFYDGGADGTSSYTWDNQDRVNFSGAQFRYTIEVVKYSTLPLAIRTANGSSYSDAIDVVKVTDKLPGGDGTNYLVNVEVLQFTDMTVNLGVTVNKWTTSEQNPTWLGNNNYTGSILNDSIDASGHDAATPSAAVDGFFSNIDYIQGGAGNDSISGGAGGDELGGGKGNDTLDGGANGTTGNSWQDLDRARFDNSINRYDIGFYKKVATGTGTLDVNGKTAGSKDYALSNYYTQDGLIIVTDKYSDAMGGDGRDVLKNIEVLQFSDAQEQLSISYYDSTNTMNQWNPAKQTSEQVQYTMRYAWGSRFGDLVTGTTAGKNMLYGQGGNDLILGGNSSDTLIGGTGDDTIDGGSHPAVDPTQPWNEWSTYDIAQFNAPYSQFKLDRFTDDANGTVTGHAGQVYFRVEHLIPASLGGLGTDIVFNVQRLQFMNGSSFYDVPLDVKIAQLSMNGTSFTGYNGTIFADTINGGNGGVMISGDAGADTLNGGDGNDTFSGGAGDDTIDGKAGSSDVARYDDAFERYTVKLFRSGTQVGGTFDKTSGFGNGVTYYASTDTITVTDRLGSSHGGDGADTLHNVEIVQFSNGGITLTNGSAASFNASNFTPSTNLTGTEGDDTLYGGPGNETLTGGTDSATKHTNIWSGGDVASYNMAPRSRFEITRNSNGKFVVIDIASVNTPTFLTNGHLDPASYLTDGTVDSSKVSSTIGYGVDTLDGIEHIQFSDVRLDLTPMDWENSYTSSYWNGSAQTSYTVTRHNITGTFLDDLLTGSNYGDVFDGRGGNDTIDGGVEDATLSGNLWDIQDVVRYEGSRERYTVKGVLVNISGSGSSKSYTIVDPSQATSSSVFGIQVIDLLPEVNGGSGTDLLVNVERIEFAAGSSSTGSNSIQVTPTFYSVDDWSVTLSGNTHPKALNIQGTEFDDVLKGTDYSDWITGGAGNDLLVGGYGGDDLDGGAGNDTIDGGLNTVGGESGTVVRSDTAHYNAPFARFTVESVYVDSGYHVVSAGTSGAVQALRVTDLLPSSDSSSLGTDILVGVENMVFSDRWVTIAPNRSSWTDWQGRTNVNIDGTVFNDILVGDRDASGNAVSGQQRDQMRGNGGNDVLIGGAGGDDLQGGLGNDVIDGGANGTTGDQWQDMDVARFTGQSSQYAIQHVSVVTSNGASVIYAEDTEIARFTHGAADLTVTGTSLADGVAEALHLAYRSLALDDGLHSSGYLVVDTLSSDLGGEGADLVFNVESLQFANGPLDVNIKVNVNDWNSDGKLDWVGVTGTSGNDTVTMAKLVELSGKTADQLSATRIDVDLREGNDVYIGGSGGESIRTGAGNDYVDGGANTGTDQWGTQMRDEVRFEGNFSRYVLIDVTLSKSGDSWALSSGKLGVTNATTTLSALASDLSILNLSDVNAALKSMVDHAGSNTTVAGWLVADKIPSEFDGMGVDALVNVEALGFSDKWMPLDMQTFYQKNSSNTIVSAFVDGTQGGDTIGYSATRAAGEYNFAGDDNLRGNEGNDTIKAGDGTDYITGGAGNDVIDGGANASSTNGMSRFDTAVYSGNFDRYTITANQDGSVTVADSLSDADGGDGTDTLTGVEALQFHDRYLRLGIEKMTNSGNIQINGSMLADSVDASTDDAVRHFINGNEGNDTLVGSNGPDQFSGGAGDDSIVGGANGTDSYGNPGFDTVRYEGNYARYTIEYGTDGATWSSTNPGGTDVLVRVTDSLADADGGTGVDILSGIEALSFFDRQLMLSTSKSVTDLNGDGRPDNAVIIGTEDNDTLTGDATNDHISGGGGNDSISGGKGADILNGGAGNDTLDGGDDGVDAQGNPLVDVAEYSGAASAYTVTNNGGGAFTVVNYVLDSSGNQTTVVGAEGTDTLTNIEGLQFSDRYVNLKLQSRSVDLNKDGVTDLIEIRGLDLTSAGDNISPATGNAAIAHHIIGGYGNDSLTGGTGADVLEGGAGNDLLNGGSGTDRAVYSGAFARYTIQYSTDGTNWQSTNPGGSGVSVKVTDSLTGGDGSDILSNIEELAFADKVVKLGTATVTTTQVDTDGNQKADTAYTTGTDGNDTISFSNEAVTLNHFVDSGAGDDSLTGGSGADTFTPGAGNDTVVGGANIGLDAAGNPNIDRAVFSGVKSGFTVHSMESASFSLSGTVEKGDVCTVTVGSATVSYTATTTVLANLLSGISSKLSDAVATGTVTVDGASQTGASLVVADTKGIIAGVTELLLVSASGSVTHDKVTAVNTSTNTLTLASSLGTAPDDQSSIGYSNVSFAVSGSTVTMTGTDTLFAVTPSVSNGTHAVTGTTYQVSGASQTGTSLTVDSVSGLQPGMYVAYTVTSGSTTTTYGPYGITSIDSGTKTLTLSSSLGASPADSATLSVTQDNVDKSLATGSVTYDHWFSVTKGSETDILRGIEQLVFDDGVTDISAKSALKASFTASGISQVANVTGTGFADILTSSTANEIFLGGAGSDHYVFADNSGNDEIHGFTAGASGDVVTVTLGTHFSDGVGLNGTGVDTVTELLARATQQGSDVVVDFGSGNSVKLVGVSLDKLTAANFEVVSNF